jgi:hypothetical protein
LDASAAITVTKQKQNGLCFILEVGFGSAWPWPSAACLVFTQLVVQPPNRKNEIRNAQNTTRRIKLVYGTLLLHKLYGGRKIYKETFNILYLWRILLYTSISSFVSAKMLSFKTMRLYFANVFLGTLFLPTFALTSSSSWVRHVIHEKRDTTQEKYIESSPLDPDDIIPARIGLKQSNLDVGLEYLSQV